MNLRVNRFGKLTPDRICECFPDDAIAESDPMSIGRPR